MAYDERDGGHRRGRGGATTSERRRLGPRDPVARRSRASAAAGATRPRGRNGSTIAPARPRATAPYSGPDRPMAARASTPASAARRFDRVGSRRRQLRQLGANIWSRATRIMPSGATGRSPSSTATMTNIGARTSRASTASSAPGARSAAEQSAGGRPGPRAYGGRRRRRQPCRHGRHGPRRPDHPHQERPGCRRRPSFDPAAAGSRRVDDKVVLNIDAEEAKRRWQDETIAAAPCSSARTSGGAGPHVLNRSFSGTYPDEE